jgi:hypothetical protein
LLSVVCTSHCTKGEGMGEKNNLDLIPEATYCRRPKKTAFIVLYKIPGRFFWTAAIDCLWKQKHHCERVSLFPDPSLSDLAPYRAGGLGMQPGVGGLRLSLCFVQRE